MRKYFYWLLGGVTFSLSCSVNALDIPKLSKYDHRVRYANYNPGDVIQLDAVVGVATVIELEKDEQYEFHVFGDSDAYDFTHYTNHLFFKPIAEEANSNLIVVTNKRNYTFRVTYEDNRWGKALYKLVLRYPEVEARKAKAKKEQQRIKKDFELNQEHINWQSYTKSGDVGLAPVHAWDDGQTTWLQFAQGAEIPAIYRVTPEGQEVLTNFNMADSRTVMLHRVAARWHLRLGEQVTALHNAAYGENGRSSSTGTRSNRVQRVLKKARD